MIQRCLVFCAALVAFHCAASDHLTPAELSKIDRRLHPVLQGGVPSDDACHSSTDAKGTAVYAVIIRGNADDVRAAGIVVRSSFGDVLTAGVSAAQLQAIARLSSVRSVDCGSKNFPQ